VERALAGALPHLGRGAGGQVTRIDSRQGPNRRTGWILLSIAAAFFIGIILKTFLFGK
jgi:hypothetical protein